MYSYPRVIDFGRSPPSDRPSCNRQIIKSATKSTLRHPHASSLLLGEKSLHLHLLYYEYITVHNPYCNDLPQLRNIGTFWTPSFGLLGKQLSQFAEAPSLIRATHPWEHCVVAEGAAGSFRLTTGTEERTALCRLGWMQAIHPDKSPSTCMSPSYACPSVWMFLPCMSRLVYVPFIYVPFHMWVHYVFSFVWLFVHGYIYSKCMSLRMYVANRTVGFLNIDTEVPPRIFQTGPH